MARSMAEVEAEAEVARLDGLRIGISSVFGDPLDPRTWSGAPSNLAAALRRLGAEVVGIDSGFRPHQKYLFAIDVLRRGGAPLEGQHVRRDAAARRHGARTVARMAQAHRLDAVLHTGTFDLPAVVEKDGPPNYLYCDHCWSLALRHLDGAERLGSRYLRRVEAQEQESYDGLAHIFTFGGYVRDELTTHYGVAPERVTVVGSGMGPVAPYHGPKDYSAGTLLFVAKHLFVEKGGPLLVEAFRRVRAARPETRLRIVARSPSDALAAEPGIEFYDFLPWEGLQALYREAALLVQPMLNDPWGQVYLEALASRTPVVGLARNGLPEITGNGRYGFLVAEPDPDALAEAILAALGEPERLAAMGAAGQQHVAASYSWDHVAACIAAEMTRQPGGTLSRRGSSIEDRRAAAQPPPIRERSTSWAARSH